MLSADVALPVAARAERAQGSRLILWAAGLLGVFAYSVVLLYHRIADGDLWAKLALGSGVWNQGRLPTRDVFAFTPTLPVYVDHEWGSGLIFYAALKLFGPESLMILKILLALGTVGFALSIARRLNVPWTSVLLLAAPAALAILPGYVIVVRSHAFTYLLFAATLLLLETMRSGQRWPALVLPIVILLWTNLHGGFVSGLCAIGIYTVASWRQPRLALTLAMTFLASLAATLVNPYGLEFWKYLLPAILHNRPEITEWQPMSLWGNDAFIGFRFLFVVAVVAFVFGRGSKSGRAESWPGLCLIAITALLALRSRRHAPFFGVTVLAFAGPYLECALRRLGECLRIEFGRGFERAVLAGYAALALFVSARYLPQASPEVLAPVGLYPVREVDILAEAGVQGNLAVPFMWGSYATWRLYPHVKVSIDGRYEAAYPESTFEMNSDFFARRGSQWDRLLAQHEIDFVIIDLHHSALGPADLVPKGYSLVWQQDGHSALLAAEKHAGVLRQTAARLSPTTINPLDPSIPAAWPHLAGAQRPSP